MASVTPIPTARAREAERALIGALLIDPSVAWPAVRDIVRTQDFARADNRTIFAAFVTAAEYSDAPDCSIVLDTLEAANQIDQAGGHDYIADIVAETGSAAHARAYAIAIREAAENRRLIEICDEVSTVARSGSVDEARSVFVESMAELELSLASIKKANLLDIEAVTAWADRDAPPPRDWIIRDMIPAGRVTSLFGNGGLGKTLLAMQLGIHTSLSQPLFEKPINGGPVLGIFCEDEQDELERRGRAACDGQMIELNDVPDFYPLSRDGHDNILCKFDHDQIVLTKFYHELEATIGAIRPRLVILDTAADLFAGDFVSTPHVRQFIKVALGGLSVRYNCAVLLLAHPSASAMSSGDGGGFSVAWNNSVRSRLYLRLPKAANPDEVRGRRVLEVRKANYSTADSVSIPLTFENGYFVLDPDPLNEKPDKSAQPKESMTRLAILAHAYMQKQAPGVAIPFGDIRADLLSRPGGLSKADKDATQRKQLQRALDQLARSDLIERCHVPRGTYRIPNGTWDNS